MPPLAPLDISSIAAVEQYAATIPGCISLAQGTVKIQSAPQLLAQHIGKQLIAGDYDGYANTYNSDRMQTAIATWLKQKYGATIDPASVIPTHGSMGALAMICLTLLEQDDVVLIPEPAYPYYAQITNIAKATAHFISCTDHENGWHLSAALLEAHRSPRTKMVLISNPVNPTGTVIAPQTLSELCTWADRNGIYLVVDEVYESFIFTNNYQSVSQSTQESPWILRTSSLSKSIAISGWRSGHAVVPKQLVKRMKQTQQALLVAPSTIAIEAATYTYLHPEIMEPYIRTIQKHHTIAAANLVQWQKIRTIAYTKPEGGIYFWITIPGLETTTWCKELMDKHKVAAVPGLCFGPSGHAALRICIARPAQELQSALTRLCSL